MNRLYISLLCVLFAVIVGNAQVSVTHASYSPIEVIPPSNTGLETVYVVHDTDGLTIAYASTTSASSVRWYKFQSAGGGYAEEITAETEGTRSILTSPQGDCGYIVEDGATRHYFWVVDYSKYQFVLNNVTFADEQDCGSAMLEVDTECRDIKYYSITGVARQLGREILISYDNLEWDADNLTYNNTQTDKTVDNLSSRLSVAAPLCSTTFTISGDRFQSQWGEVQMLTTDLYQTKTIAAQTTAVQQERENPNEQKGDAGTLGGSAPSQITFTSYCTDAVTYKEWQISRQSDFSTIDYRYNEESIDYTFREEGTFYVRFLAANSDDTCSEESETYTVTIGESLLDCPNAFSPDATPGVNDEWKVSYKSLVSFKCWIFDRYGNQIISFEDPSQGWDGKYKGKYVKPGVYYYVIEAVGADGNKYKKKGDINILKSTRTSSTNESTTE